MVAKPKCKLIGVNGNAFMIMGEVRRALKKAGQSEKEKEFVAKAMQGGYDQLLQTAMEYVEVY